MRIRIFSHDSNPDVDRPVCHKSIAYAEALVVDGLALWLSDHRSVICLPPEELRPKATVDELVMSSDAHGPLTGKESVHNAVGVVDQAKRALFAVEMRAMAKVRNYGPPAWSYRGKKDGYSLTPA